MYVKPTLRGVYAQDYTDGSGSAETNPVSLNQFKVPFPLCFSVVSNSKCRKNMWQGSKDKVKR